MKSTFLLFYLIMSMQSFAQQEMPLYEGAIPNSKPCATKEILGADGILRGIVKPALYMFVPAQKDSLKTAVIICPGGGYANLYMTNEGFEVAERFVQKGITAFVLKNRVPIDSECVINKEIVALQDAQQVVKLIREQADKLDINPHMLGMMGFSAGGHLASTVATHFNTCVIENPNNTSVRPDFIVLAYPVISFQDSLAHLGSRNNMLGKNPSTAKKILYSNELQVTPQTPPCFLIHASNDPTVSVENSLLFYEALLKNKVPAEIHLLQKGGHGFGLHNKAEPINWLQDVFTWMKANKFMKGNVH